MGRNFHQYCYLILFGMFLIPASSYAQYSAFEDPPVPGATGATAGSFEFGPAKAEIEGGDIPTGQTSQVIVMMRNNASSPVTLKSIDIVPSSNVTATVAANQCGNDAIKPGIECPVTISVKGEASGKYRVGMLINHTGRTGVSNAAITGTVNGGTGTANGMPANELEAFPNAIDFGDAKGRAPLVRSLTLRNSSTKPITIEDINLVASPLTGFSVSAASCKDLQPSQSCVATVTWTPSVEGQSEGVLALSHTGPSGSLQIPIKGSYQITKTEKLSPFPTLIPGEGLIVADREAVDFGEGVDGAASITVSLVNNGDKAVTLKQVRLAGSDNGLSLSTNDCAEGKVLDASQGCALTVNWFPRRPGPVIDDIQIIHNGARGVLILPVRGKATQTASTNMPLLTSSSIPKIGKSALNEDILGGVGTGEKVSGKSEGKSSGASSMLSDNTTALNGYRVTSLSAQRAVITGPSGRIVVEDGKPQVIANGHWLPSISNDGVELIGSNDSVFLIFDRSLVLTNTTPAAKAFPATTYTANTSSSSSSFGSTSSSGSSSSPSSSPASNPAAGGGVRMP